MKRLRCQAERIIPLPRHDMQAGQRIYAESSVDGAMGEHQ